MPSPRKFAVLPGGQGRPAPSPAGGDPLLALAKAAGRREPQAVNRLLLAIGAQVLRVTRGVLGARHPDVEDVAQECAYAVVDALPSFRGDSTVMHFVRRISLLTAMNARRRERTAKRAAALTAPLGEFESIADSRPGPEHALLSHAAAELVRDLLALLPSEQAEALALHLVLGYTLQELEKASGVSAETWKSRLRLAKHALRLRVLANPRALELAEFTLASEEAP